MITVYITNSWKADTRFDRGAKIMDKLWKAYPNESVFIIPFDQGDHRRAHAQVYPYDPEWHQEVNELLERI